jgi:ABC-type transport system involved in cytochrome c biogenesis ATPase subunit
MSPEHSIPSISIFGGEYNAKTRSLEQIAESFIAPVKAFRRITQPDNTILIGPRGSGKTTLLTMLQGPALERSPSEEAQLARERVNYTGVLVPCDQAWAGQLRSLTGAICVARSACTHHRRGRPARGCPG